jgi:hypothetical protein
MEEVAIAGVSPKNARESKKKTKKKIIITLFLLHFFVPLLPLLLFKARRDKCLSCIAFRELGRPKVRFFFARLL